MRIVAKLPKLILRFHRIGGVAPGFPSPTRRNWIILAKLPRLILRFLRVGRAGPGPTRRNWRISLGSLARILKFLRVGPGAAPPTRRNWRILAKLPGLIEAATFRNKHDLLTFILL